MTRLRLLAPPSVVNDAIALLENEYLLAEPCFMETPAQKEVVGLVRAVRQARARLLESARSALGLRDTKGTGNFEMNLNWRGLRVRFMENLTEAQPSDAEW